MESSQNPPVVQLKGVYFHIVVGINAIKGRRLMHEQVRMHESFHSNFGLCTRKLAHHGSPGPTSIDKLSYIVILDRVVYICIIVLKYACKQLWQVPL